jgi:hypothetical protein
VEAFDRLDLAAADQRQAFLNCRQRSSALLEPASAEVRGLYAPLGVGR